MEREHQVHDRGDHNELQESPWHMLHWQQDGIALSSISDATTDATKASIPAEDIIDRGGFTLACVGADPTTTAKLARAWGIKLPVQVVGTTAIVGICKLRGIPIHESGSNLGYIQWDLDLRGFRMRIGCEVDLRWI